MKLSNRKIMIVDDDLLLASTLSEILAKEGAETAIALNGKVGFHENVMGNFDAIIMDLAMPKLDGVATIRTLRLVGLKTPIVVLTGHATPEHFAEAREAGADICYAKPPNFSVLIDSLADLIAQKNAPRQNAEV